MTDTERAVLELAVEDSHALSEVVACVRAEDQSLSLAQARDIARNVTKALLEQGLVQFTRKSSVHQEEQEIADAAALEEMDSDLAWMETRHWKPHLRVLATVKGREAYFASGELK